MVGQEIVGEEALRFSETNGDHETKKAAKDVLTEREGTPRGKRRPESQLAFFQKTRQQIRLMAGTKKFRKKAASHHQGRREKAEGLQHLLTSGARSSGDRKRRLSAVRTKTFISGGSLSNGRVPPKERRSET